MSELLPHCPYDPAVLEPARQMTANGATTWELAVHFGVSPLSVELWAACHLEFAEALRVGRSQHDDRVERAWYSRCVGFERDSEKIVTEKNAGHGGVDIIRVPTREYVPPDAAACKDWLRNRRPEHWNERHEVRLDATLRRAEDGPVLDLESCGPDEIQREYAAALAASAPGKLLAPPAAGDSR